MPSKDNKKYVKLPSSLMECWLCDKIAEYIVTEGGFYCKNHLQALKRVNYNRFELESAIINSRILKSHIAK